MQLRRRLVVFLAIFSLPALLGQNNASADEPADLVRQATPLIQCLTGSRDRYSLSAKVTAQIDGKPHAFEGRLVRYDDQQFDLTITHADYAVDLRRRADTTEFALPLHKTVFVGSGAVDAKDHLASQDATSRIVSSGSMVLNYVMMLEPDHGETIVKWFKDFSKLRYDSAADRWIGDDQMTIRFSEDGQSIDWKMEVYMESGK